MSNIKTILLELNQRPIAYYPVYVTLTGSLTAGVLFSQLMYWYSIAKDEFYKTDAEIMDETKLTAGELRTAKARLKQFDFVHIRVAGIPAKTYYDINIEYLIDAINKTSFVKSAKLAKRNQRNKRSEIKQTNTENTSNTTQKNTSYILAETKFQQETVGEVANEFEMNGEPLPTKQPRATSTPPEFRGTPPTEKAPNQVYQLFEAYANFCEAKGLPMSRNANGHFIMPVKEAAALKSWAKWAAGMPNAGDPLTDWQAFLNAAWQHGDKFIKANFTPSILQSKTQSIMYAVNKHRIAQKELQDAVMQGGGIDDLLNP